MNTTIAISDRKWNQYWRVSAATVACFSMTTAGMPNLRASISTISSSAK